MCVIVKTSYFYSFTKNYAIKPKLKKLCQPFFRHSLKLTRCQIKQGFLVCF